jgi:hypothetical protein
MAGSRQPIFLASAVAKKGSVEPGRGYAKTRGGFDPLKVRPINVRPAPPTKSN